MLSIVSPLFAVLTVSMRGCSKGFGLIRHWAVSNAGQVRSRSAQKPRRSQFRNVLISFALFLRAPAVPNTQRSVGALEHSVRSTDWTTLMQSKLIVRLI